MENIKEYSLNKKEALKKEILGFTSKPKLVIIQLNEDVASNAYIKGKIKDLSEIGADFEHIKLPIETLEEDLIKLIDKLNKDDSVHGIIVQMPLPKGICEDNIKASIIPIKDVDGFHPMSPYKPATPFGIETYLKDNGYDFNGKNALVIGRSNIVGKPMAKLLLNDNANVTVVHSKTKKEDFEFYLKKADLIVVAIGKQHYLDHSYQYNPDAVIVDVGINRNDEGKLTGDAMEDLPVAFKTPVPGGVGLLTRLALLLNLVIAYKNQGGK